LDRFEERFYRVGAEDGPVSRAPATGEIQRERTSASSQREVILRDLILDAIVEVVAERVVRVHRERILRAFSALSREIGARGHARPPLADDRRVHVPEVLLGVRAHRARLCLLYVAEQGERGVSPSSQRVAVGIGLADRRQVLGALGKLVALGLLVKHAGGAGYANAWSLTSVGEQVAPALAGQG
jgi:hypothetical protein